MYELLLVLGFGVIAYRGISHSEEEVSPLPRKISEKLGRLWDIAHQGMRENRFLRAEKALLTILKIDEKNAAAYNRLGILYAKQKEYKDAIDCFEIASSIEPSASSLHNLGLIYFETENYTKAATAFEESLRLEDELAARHIAYAKVQEKLGNAKLMIQELEKAVSLEPTKESYTLLMRGYQAVGKFNEAAAIDQRLSKLVPAKGVRPKRLTRPKRVVI
jgi:tetratricopeptide (TPR) repeat protein